MSIALSYRPDREQSASATPRNEVARVEVLHDMAAAEPFWRRLEDGGALATPYQRFDLLAAWQLHVGTRTGVMPFIVTGFDRAGEPLFLWPFGATTKGPLSLGRFLGSKHANFNVGLWRRDVVPTITARDISSIFAGLADRVDLVA